MKMECKKTVENSGLVAIFTSGDVYEVLSTNSKTGEVKLRDNLGCFRWLPTTGKEASFIKEHFIEVK